MSTFLTGVVWVDGQPLRIRLEAVMWKALHEIARQTGCSVADLTSEINRVRGENELPDAIRDYIVEYYRENLRRVLTDGGTGRRG